MVVGQVRRIAPWLAVLAIVAGGVVLGVLQVRWIGEASRAEEVRLRASLYRGVEQVRNHAEDEIRVLLSIARSATAALASGDDADISESLRLWQENTRFPKLLQGFWLVMDTATGRSRSWSQGSSTFVAATPPAVVAATLPGAASQADEMGAWQVVELPGERRLVLLPVRKRAAAVAVEIDGRVFTGEIVPFYMNRNLAEFPWRLVDAGDGATLDESGTIADGAVPEAMVGLRSLGLSGFDARNARRPATGGSADGPLDPLLQAWLQRAHGESVTIALPPEQLPGEGAEALLAVFYPGGTLAGTVRARQASSLAVSLGLVAMLVAGVGVLTRLYRRSVRLRASEQEFVASISHELRTPIAVIQATSDNLRTGAVSDPSRLPRYAGVIHGQVKRLAGMVESILLYAGLETGKSRRPATGEVALPQLIDEVTQPLAQLAAERGCRLAVTATALPPTICADRTALRLVVENLVTNAIHHAGPTEVRLGVRWRPDRTLEITVEDDGAGIPAREQARIFEPFVRGESSVREQRPGSGLGLHLVRRVAGLHGGRVTLASPYRDDTGVPRSGCRFVAVLPAPESCDEG